MKAEIRKIVTFVEETHREMEKGITPPTRRAAAVAVIANPFAGKYVEDLTPLMEIGEELGKLLAEKAVAALGIEGARAESYGKAAAVGNGTHFGFIAASKEAVHAFYDAAIAAGARGDGAPGPRAEYGAPYYGCFVRDLDGHKIEAAFWDHSLES